MAGCEERTGIGETGDRVPVGSVVQWGLATFGPGRRLEGLIGPFDSPAAAQRHARERCYGDWVVAPMVCVADVEGVPAL